MLDRLNKVAAHFEKRDDICAELPSFTQTDYKPAAPKYGDLTRLITRIQEEELSIFFHIVHLKADIERLLEAFGLKKSAIGMISEFKPFKIAEKFVNEQSAVGQNNPKSVKQYYTFVAKSKSDAPSLETPIYAFISLLEFNKDIYPSIELILDLIKIWKFFLDEHVEVNIDHFMQKHTAVLNRNTVYSAYVPKEFFQAVHKIFEKKGLSTNKELVVIEGEIKERLSFIVSISEELDRLRNDLSRFTQAETHPAPAKNKDLEELLLKIKSQEVSILSELVHLRENIKKHARARGGKTDELKAIDEFKPYRIASNFVNAHKHGTSGYRPSAKIDYTSFCFERVGRDPSPKDPLIAVTAIINYDGDLRQTEVLILDLMLVWRLFFKYHMEIDVEFFNRRIRAISERIQKSSYYSATVPKGWLVDAKRLSDERKGLDI